MKILKIKLWMSPRGYFSRVILMTLPLTRARLKKGNETKENRRALTCEITTRVFKYQHPLVKNYVNLTIN